MKKTTALSFILSSIVSLALCAFCLNASAADPNLSKLDLAKLLVQLSGDTGKFTPTSTPDDYRAWALARGVDLGGRSVG